MYTSNFHAGCSVCWLLLLPGCQAELLSRVRCCGDVDSRFTARRRRVQTCSNMTQVLRRYPSMYEHPVINNVDINNSRSLGPASR
ncbi:hypothetical protein HDV57DRAFT_497554 [Trichoderma longibrachiatum]